MSRTLLETRGTLSAAACMQASPCGTTVTLMGGYWQIKQVVDREGSQDVQVYIVRENAAVLARTCDCDSLSCGKWIICQDRLGTDRRSSRNAQNEGGGVFLAHREPTAAALFLPTQHPAARTGRPSRCGTNTKRRKNGCFLSSTSLPVCPEPVSANPRCCSL